AVEGRIGRGVFRLKVHAQGKPGRTYCPRGQKRSSVCRRRIQIMVVGGDLESPAALIVRAVRSGEAFAGDEYRSWSLAAIRNTSCSPSEVVRSRGHTRALDRES